MLTNPTMKGWWDR